MWLGLSFFTRKQPIYCIRSKTKPGDVHTWGLCCLKKRKGVVFGVFGGVAVMRGPRKLAERPLWAGGEILSPGLCERATNSL